MPDGVTQPDLPLYGRIVAEVTGPVGEHGQVCPGKFAGDFRAEFCLKRIAAFTFQGQTRLEGCAFLSVLVNVEGRRAQAADGIDAGLSEGDCFVAGFKLGMRHRDRLVRFRIGDGIREHRCTVGFHRGLRVADKTGQGQARCHRTAAIEVGRHHLAGRTVRRIIIDLGGLVAAGNADAQVMTVDEGRADGDAVHVLIKTHTSCIRIIAGATRFGTRPEMNAVLQFGIDAADTGIAFGGRQDHAVGSTDDGFHAFQNMGMDITRQGRQGRIDLRGRHAVEVREQAGEDTVGRLTICRSQIEPRRCSNSVRPQATFLGQNTETLCHECKLDGVLIVDQVEPGIFRNARSRLVDHVERASYIVGHDNREHVTDFSIEIIVCVTRNAPKDRIDRTVGREGRALTCQNEPVVRSRPASRGIGAAVDFCVEERPVIERDIAGHEEGAR